MDGADVDNAAGKLCFPEAADEGLCGEEGSFHIDVEHEIVILLGDVPEGRSLLDARVVDEDVAAAELLPGLVDELLSFGELGDVCLHDDRSCTGGLNLLNGVVGTFWIAAVVDDDVCAFGCEPDCDGLADSGGRTGDDCYLTLKPGHAFVLLFTDSYSR